MLFHSQSQIESRSRKLFREPLSEGLSGAALAGLELDKIARVVVLKCMTQNQINQKSVFIFNYLSIKNLGATQNIDSTL